MNAPLDDGSDLKRIVVELTRERDAALAREAALAEVLDLINRCPGDPGPVFSLILEKAHTLCGAAIGALSIYDGTLMHTLAMRGFPDDYAARMREPWPPPEVTTQCLIDGADVVHIPDAVAIGQRFGFMTGRSDMRTTLVVPLRRNDAFLGQITAFRAEVRPFSEEQIALLRRFGDLATLAIENARLLETLRGRTDELARRNSEFAERIEQQAATIDVLQAMSASLGDPRPVFDLIAVRARDICAAYGVTVYEFDGSLIHRHAETGVSDDPAEREAAKAGYPMPPTPDRLAGRAILDRGVVHIRDHRADPDLLWLPHFDTARSSVTVPMMRAGVPIGCLSMGSRETGGFSDSQIELLKTFAEQAVIAITSAETYRALQTRTADLQESLEYQTATSDVLKAISRSAFDLQPVLDTLITTAARLCEAENGFLMERDGDMFRAKATCAVSPTAAAILQGLSLKMDRGTITGRAALEGRAVQIEDVTTDPDYALAQTMSVAHNRTLLSVPLLREGVVVGAITLGRQKVKPFTDQQIALVSTFADQAVIAIENTRLLTEQREALEQQTATAEVLQVINASPGNLQPVFDTILEKAHDLCDTPLGGLMIWDGTHIRAVATHGFPDQFAARLRRGFPPSRASQSLLDGARLFHIPDAMADAPDPRAQGVQETGARTTLLIPLRKDGEFLGYISSFRKEVRPFSDKEIALLENFAAQAVIAIENARLLTETREALEQQTATADLLRIINESPGDPQPVFDAMLEKATLLCGVASGFLATWDGTTRQVVAARGLPPAMVEYAATRPVETTLSPSVMRVLETARPYQSVDLMDDIGYREGHPDARMIVDLGGMRTCVHVPLVKDDGAIGYFSFYRREVSAFSRKEIALMESFAAQAVIAMENARLLSELRERTAELAERNAAFAERIDHQAATIDVLKEMSNSPGDAQPVFDLICRQAKALLGAPIVALLEYDGTLVHLRANPGVEDVIDKALYAAYQSNFPMVPDRGSLSCRAILDGSIVHIRDLSTEPGISETIRVMGYKTQVAIPLMRDGHAIGAIAAASMEADGISDTQIELLRTFAEQAVIAIQSAETYRALQERTAALARRNSEFGERIEQQAATIDVLKIMSSTPDDTKPVFDQIIRRAKELCNSTSAGMFEYRDGLVHYSGIHTDVDMNTPSFSAYVAQFPMVPTRDSMSCRVILDNQLLHIRDMEQQTGLSAVTRALVEDGLYRSFLAVPLSRDGQAIGCIWLSTPEPGGYTDSQIALLQTFAEQAVIAIGSVATFRALRERTAELAQRNSEFGERIEQQAATIDVLKVMSSTPDDTQPVFDQIVRRARELCNSPSAALFQFDGELVHYSARALPEGFDESADEFVSYRDRFPMAPDPGSLTCRAILEKRVIHIRDTQVEPGLSQYVRDVFRGSGLRSQVTVPLLRDGTALGAITLNSLTFGGFTDSQIALLQTFAEQAVIAVGSVATFRALRERTDELAQRQNELRVTFENMGDGVAMFDESQRLVAWNRRFQDIIEVPDDVIARRPTIRDYIRYLAERGEYGPDADPDEQISRLTETIGQRLAYERTRPNGTIVEIRRNPVASGGFVVIYADITERKRAETAIRAARDDAETALRDLQTAQDRLIQAEKMASLGQLTAGIAHEIKNPLNFVNNFAALSVELLDELKETAAPAFATLDGDARADVEDLTETLTGNLKKIEEHGKRADGIVRSMLEHSRGSSGEHRAVDLNELVDEALNLAFHGARARDQSFNITLERDFSTAIAPIDVNPQDLTRVFLNLFSNGFYAANKRAKDGAAAGFAPVLKASTRDLGHAVEIRVRDNGTGIPDEIRDKLFQPFFTTKPTGEGTGLGLSITYDIVTKQHRGTIAVESKVGSFTEFIVTLPREPRPGEGAPISGAVTRTGRDQQ